LLKALNGHGPNATSFNEYWQGGGLAYKGVHYNIGPSPETLQLNLVNEQEYTTTPLWNVIGIINGTIPDEVIVLGNHRDAWIAGGAGDPNSGSAALNEVIRSFGVAMKAGWKPLRTIVFASWDGEEYGLVGSTEWVEEYLPWLSATTIAYLNVDVGARGPDFTAAASPLLNQVIYNVTGIVQSPNQTTKGQTVQDTWNGQIKTMGSGSDFTAFQDFAGIPSLDLGFAAGPKDPVYHYHSNYDSFWWMDHFGDSHWHYHVTITKIWALIAATLSETPIIALNATDYGNGLQAYLDSVKAKANATTLSRSFSFHSLDNATTNLQEAATSFDSYAFSLAQQVGEGVPWWRWWSRVRLYYEVRKVNQKVKLLERQFLYANGLDHRSWFKHVVFAPGRWTGYAGATYPGLVESFEDENLHNARKWSRIIEERLLAAADLLKI
jgi:N-acetylated-alpha-linked acidic dipeptidase